MVIMLVALLWLMLSVLLSALVMISTLVREEYSFHSDVSMLEPTLPQQPLHSQLNFQVKVQHHLLHLAVVRLQVQVARLQALAVARLPQARPVLVDHPALVRQALVSLVLQALLARLAVLVAARQVVLEVVLAVQLTHKQPTTPGRRLALSWS